MLFDLGYPPHQAEFARPGHRGASLQDFYAAFPTEAACIRHVFEARFGRDYICPTCGVASRWAVVNQRRMVIHRRCITRISPLAGTLMRHSRVPAQLWFYLMLHLANSPESANGGDLSRNLGVDSNTIQRMLFRVRLHLAKLDYTPIIGSEAAVVHVRLARVKGAYYRLQPKRNVAHILVLACDSAIHTVVIDRSRQNLLRRVLERVHPGAAIVTDCYHTARLLGRYRAAPPNGVTFDPLHFHGQPAGSDCSTGFLASFRRGLRLQHQHVQIEFLWLYLAEYQFRYNRRFRSADIFWDMVARFPAVTSADELQLRRWSSDVEPQSRARYAP